MTIVLIINITFLSGMTTPLWSFDTHVCILDCWYCFIIMSSASY